MVAGTGPGHRQQYARWNSTLGATHRERDFASIMATPTATAMKENAPGPGVHASDYICAQGEEPASEKPPGWYGRGRGMLN